MTEANYQDPRDGSPTQFLAWGLKPGAVVWEQSAFALTPLGEEFGELFVAAILVPDDDEEFRWARGL